jgi:hypothetical protein
MNRSIPMRLLRPGALLLVTALTVAACGGRRPPLPAVSAPLAGAVLMASLAGADGEQAAPVGPLLIDSISFARLGLAAGADAFSAAELERQIGRPFTLVDPTEVLVCPPREPCRVVNDGVYIEVWEAERSGAELELVVSRVQNVRGLYVLTRAVTHRLAFRPDGAGWRLVRRDQLPT